MTQRRGFVGVKAFYREHTLAYPQSQFKTSVGPKVYTSTKINKKCGGKDSLKSINKKCCTIYKALKVQNYFSLKDETPLALQANVVYRFEGFVVITKPILVKQSDVWQLGLWSIFHEIQPFFTYIHLQCM